MTRFLACFLMHLQLLDEVHDGLVMLKYLGCHPEEFSNRTMPFLCAFMKSSGALLAEGINMLMLATRKDVPMCITFFVAFHVLADIDKIYLESVSNLRLLEAIEHPIPWKTKMRDINFEEVSLSMKLVLLVYYVWSFLYYTVYYYFMPFFVNFIPYLFVPTNHSDVSH